MALHLALHPAARHGPDGRGSQSHGPVLARSLHHRPRQRVFTAGLHGGGQVQPPAGVHTRDRRMAQQPRLTHGEGAGLVKGHRLDPVRLFQRLRILDQDAVTGRHAGARHDSGRCGQAQRTGTGDHQHGHGMDDGVFHGGAGQPPARQGQQGHRQHHRHEHLGHTVDQTLDRGFGRLRVLHHADDACQHGFGAHGLHLHHDPAFAIDGAGRQRIAHGFGDGQRFTGEHRFVGLGVAFEHLAIHRDPLAGAHHQAVTGHDFLQGHIGFPLRPEPMRLRGPQGLQGSNGCGGLAARTCLEPFAQQHQGNHHRRGLEVKMRLVAGRRQQPQPHREQPAGTGAYGHQQVHVATHGADGVPTGFVKTRAQYKLHRRGQKALPQRRQHQVLAPQGGHHGQHQWRRQHQGGGDGGKSFPWVFVLALFVGGGQMRFVAGVAHRPHQAGRQLPLIHRFDAGTFRSQVDAGAVHA